MNAVPCLEPQCDGRIPIVVGAVGTFTLTCRRCGQSFEITLKVPDGPRRLHGVPDEDELLVPDDDVLRGVEE